MEQRFTGRQLATAFDTWRSYLADLLEVRFEDFQTKLRLFVNYAESDDVWRILSARLRTMDGVDGRAWLDADEGAELPDAPARRAALVFQVLDILKKRRVDVRTFLVSRFPGSTIQAKFEAFQTGTIAELDETLGGLLEEALTRVDDEEKVVASTWFDRLLAGSSSPPGPAEDTEDTGETEEEDAEASGAAETVADPLGALDEAVRGAEELSPETREDLAKDVEILGLEMGKNHPERTRAASILRDIAEAGIGGGAVRTLRERLEADDDDEDG